MTILYFAWVRERIGCGEERVEPPPSVATVSDLADWLQGRGPAYVEALGDRERLRVAVDQAFTGWDAPISSAREVAFFPPVTGG